MALLSRARRRKLGKILGWERAKEAGVYALDPMLRRFDVLPLRFYRAAVELGEALLRAFYFAPWNPWRRACADMARLRGRGTGRDIYLGLVANLGAVARLFLVLLARGPDEAVGRMGFEPGARHRIEQARGQGGGFLLLPHCVGGVLSAAYFARQAPTVIISRGPASPRRAAIQRTFLRKLGVDLLVIDRMAKGTVARNILRTVKSGRFVVATTDLMKKTDESVPASFFSQPVHLPSWPARFSAKTGRPILAGYVYVRDGGLVIRAGEPFRAQNVEEATGRWSRAFQQDILELPSDWAFLFDLRWARLLRRAVKESGARGG